MSNLILIFIEILVTFSTLLFAYKFFGKYGLITWVAIATVLANVITAKNVDICGLNVAIGTVMFASTFLATDILSEKYCKEDAKYAVYIGLFSSAMLIVSSQIALAYKPSEIDYAHDAMSLLFGLNLRISLASMLMYFIANMADVYIFTKIKEKMQGKKLWVRNNVSTIICNCLENFGFIWLAFVGIYDSKTILSIALSTSVVEIIVALCDTPFLYLATKINPVDMRG